MKTFKCEFKIDIDFKIHKAMNWFSFKQVLTKMMHII